MPVDFPVDHLSASSMTKFLRCPRQWQESYLYKEKGISNSSLVIGSAVHLGLSRLLKDEEPADFFNETVEETLNDYGEIDWKDTRFQAEQWAKKHLYDYARFAKHFRVVDTEVEIELDIPGVPIPVVGFIDVVTENSLIDIKTTRYFNRKVELNPEWKLQANIYQLHKKVPAEFHVLTRAKINSVVVPTGSDSQLYVEPPQARNTERYIRQIWDVMDFYYKRFGDDEWPGNVTHPWAGKYCGVENCCQRS